MDIFLIAPEREKGGKFKISREDLSLIYNDGEEEDTVGTNDHCFH